jgi:hypothetical protein
MYHDRTAWCAFFVGKKYGCSKGYPQRNAAHKENGSGSDARKMMEGRLFIGQRKGRPCLRWIG